MAKSSRSRQSAEADEESASSQRSGATNVAEPGRSRGPPEGAMTGPMAERRYGMEITSGKQIRELQRMERRYGEDVFEWTQEGMPIEAMGKTAKMAAFRQRKGTPVPWNVEERNEESVYRSKQAASDTSPAGDAGVPDTVREVISSQGRSLDPSIQRAVEDRMDDALGDVRIHTGPDAAQACESIDARAFTVGNHVAFNHGEYDPSSPEGQHVLAHELAHVRQQTGGAVSMLPQDDLDLEIDPDPALEREAEETAQHVMEGGELGIQRLSETEVHVQRSTEEVDMDRRSIFTLGNPEVGVPEEGAPPGKIEQFLEEFTSLEFSVTHETLETIVREIEDVDSLYTYLDDRGIDATSSLEEWIDSPLIRGYRAGGATSSVVGLIGLGFTPAAVGALAVGGTVAYVLREYGDEIGEEAREWLRSRLDATDADLEDQTDDETEAGRSRRE